MLVFFSLPITSSDQLWATIFAITIIILVDFITKFIIIIMVKLMLRVERFIIIFIDMASLSYH